MILPLKKRRIVKIFFLNSFMVYLTIKKLGLVKIFFLIPLWFILLLKNEE